MNKRVFAACLIGLLMAASFLRFTGLKERGIFLCDEGDYLSGGRTVAAAINYAVKRIFYPGLPVGSFSAYLSGHGGGYASAVKPGYYLLVALSFLAGGVHDYSALYLSAVLGLLTIILVFLIARLLYNRRIALYSAILLTFSPFHINYSRSAFSVSSAVFFLYLGLFFLLRYMRDIRDRDRDSWLNLILGGIALGYSFSCHYNLIASMGLIFLLFIFALFNLKFPVLKRLMCLIASFIAPLILLETPYWVVKHLTKGMTGVTTGAPYNIKTYFEQLLFIMTKTFFYKRPQAPFLSYTDLLFRTEGIAVLILFLLGSVFILRRIFRDKEIGDIYLFALGPFMFILFSMLGEKAPRTILSVMPAFYIIGAVFLFEAEAKIRKAVKNRRAAYTAIVLPLWLSIIASQCYLSYDYIRFHSPYLDAVNYMKARGDFRHFSTNPPVSIFYAGLKNTSPYWDMTLEEAKRLYKTRNYRYLVLELGEGGSRYRNGLVDLALRSDVKPVFEEKYKPLPLVLEDLFFYKYKTDEPVIVYYKYKDLRPEDYPSVRVISLDDLLGG